MSNDQPVVRRTRRVFLAMAGTSALAAPLGTFANSAAHSGTSPGTAQTSGAPTVKVEKDVIVGKGGDTDLHCDIYRPPPGTEKRMALVHLHGGSLIRGSKDTLAGQVTPITARGYVSIAAQYRLAGEAKWPAQLEDVKTTIRWTRANADRLGIDPSRIAAVGYSAGGHLVLSAASAGDTHLAACVGFYPAVEVAMDKLQAMLQSGIDPTALPNAMPLNYEFKEFPPTIIFHGLADTVVPPESSEHLLHELRGTGIPAELHTFAGVPHGFDSRPEFAEACAPLTDFFLDRYVLNPRTYPPFVGGSIRPASGGSGASDNLRAPLS